MLLPHCLSVDPTNKPRVSWLKEREAVGPGEFSHLQRGERKPGFLSIIDISLWSPDNRSFYSLCSPTQLRIKNAIDSPVYGKQALCACRNEQFFPLGPRSCLNRAPLSLSEVDNRKRSRNLEVIWPLPLGGDSVAAPNPGAREPVTHARIFHWRPEGGRLGVGCPCSG